jgi:hypothetical protein
MVKWHTETTCNIPITGLYRPRVFQNFKVPIFQNNRHMKVVSWSALRTGHIYLPGNISGTHFCRYVAHDCTVCKQTRIP